MAANFGKPHLISSSAGEALMERDHLFSREAQRPRHGTPAQVLVRKENNRLRRRERARNGPLLRLGRVRNHNLLPARPLSRPLCIARPKYWW